MRQARRTFFEVGEIVMSDTTSCEDGETKWSV